MKNKKIIFLTLLVIAVVIIGVIGMSKRVESSWQTPDGVDNQLAVNENNLQVEESVFDYPYFNIKDHKQLTDNSVKERYSTAINTYELASKHELNNKISIANFDKEPTKDMVSFQYVSNVCGEVIKYLYGITEHQNFPAAIIYYYYGDVNEYEYRWYTDTHLLELVVDAYTGDIKHISTSGGLIIELDGYIEENKDTDFLMEDTKSALIAQVKEDLDVIGNHKEIEKIEFLDADTMYDHYKYHVRIIYTDKTDSLMWYGTVNLNHFELTYYVR